MDKTLFTPIKNPDFQGLLEQFDQVIQSHPSQAEELAQEALSLATTEYQRGLALMRLGWAERMLSQLEVARVHSDEALMLLERYQDVENHTFALIMAGAIDVYQGNREQAHQRLMLALRQSQQIGNKLYEARACNSLGALFDWYGNQSLSIEYLLKALVLARELGQAMFENMVLSNLGVMHYRQQAYQKALECYQQSLIGLTSLGVESAAQTTQMNIAECQIKLGAAAQAEVLLEQFLQEGTDETKLQCFAMYTLGTALLAQKKHEQALQKFREVLKLAQKHDFLEETGLAFLGIGQSYLALQEFGQAKQALLQAKAGLMVSSVENQLEMLKALVTAFEYLGDYKSALRSQQEHSQLEQQYRETNSQRHVQSLMLHFEMAQQIRQTEAALGRNRDLELAIQEKERLAAELERLSLQDPLTGLYNRRYLDQHFAQLLEVSATQGRTVGVALLDIDHFKNVNDQFSHLLGDQVLRQTALLLLEHLRQTDISARFGGEEFLIIFPDTTTEHAALLCERLRSKIEAFAWQRLHQHLSVTVSLGLAFAQAHEPCEALLARADQMLYLAKQNGRNQVKTDDQLMA